MMPQLQTMQGFCSMPHNMLSRKIFKCCWFWVFPTALSKNMYTEKQQQNPTTTVNKTERRRKCIQYALHNEAFFKSCHSGKRMK